MKQLGLGQNLSTKRTRKREFLDEMERVVPWAPLVQVVEPYCPKAKTGRLPFRIETMLRIHYLQQWFALSAPAMEEEHTTCRCSASSPSVSAHSYTLTCLRA